MGSVHLSERENAVIFCLTEPLQPASHHKLVEILRLYYTDPRRLVLDLSDLDFIGSLEQSVFYHALGQERELCLVAQGGVLSGLRFLAEHEPLLRVFGSVEAALAA